MDNSTLQNIIGMLAIVIPTVVAIYIYFKQRSEKNLEYLFLTAYPIVSIHDNVEGKLKVYYDDKAVLNPYLAAIEFTCNGQKEILPSDYIEPITIRFGSAKFLLAKVHSTRPKNLNVAVEVTEQTAEITPTLLNKGDKFTVTFVLDGYAVGSKPLVNARIAGLSAIKETPSKIDQSNKFSLWLGLIILIFFLATELFPDQGRMLLLIFIAVIAPLSLRYAWVTRKPSRYSR